MRTTYIATVILDDNGKYKGLLINEQNLEVSHTQDATGLFFSHLNTNSVKQTRFFSEDGFSSDFADLEARLEKLEDQGCQVFYSDTLKDYLEEMGDR